MRHSRVIGGNEPKPPTPPESKPEPAPPQPVAPEELYGHHITLHDLAQAWPLSYLARLR